MNPCLQRQILESFISCLNHSNTSDKFSHLHQHSRTKNTEIKVSLFDTFENITLLNAYQHWKALATSKFLFRRGWRGLPCEGAQLTGGFILRGLLAKPRSQVAFCLPPGVFCLHHLSRTRLIYDTVRKLQVAHTRATPSPSSLSPFILCLASLHHLSNWIYQSHRPIDPTDRLTYRTEPEV